MMRALEWVVENKTLCEWYITGWGKRICDTIMWKCNTEIIDLRSSDDENPLEEKEPACRKRKAGAVTSQSETATLANEQADREKRESNKQRDIWRAVRKETKRKATDAAECMKKYAALAADPTLDSAKKQALVETLIEKAMGKK